MKREIKTGRSVRKSWIIKPTTKVKPSDKLYSRKNKKIVVDEK